LYHGTDDNYILLDKYFSQTYGFSFKVVQYFFGQYPAGRHGSIQVQYFTHQQGMSQLTDDYTSTQTM
jgi:hypothetical protein